MGLSDRKQRMKKLLQRSKDLIKKTTKMEQRVSKHTKGKETTPISRFDDVKADELKRLRNLKNRLEKLKESLIPNETEEEYFRQMGDEAGATSTSKVISVGPGANSTLEDEEEEDEEEEDEEEEEEGEKDVEGDEEIEEERDEENQEEKSSPGKSGSKLRRMSLFRRSSKSSKDVAAKLKATEAGVPEETKKERKEREKRERLLEKEKQEQAKREKREQEKREKQEKERLEKERKEKEKEKKKGRADKKGVGKGKLGKSSGSQLDGISEQSEEDEEDEDIEEEEDHEENYENDGKDKVEDGEIDEVDEEDEGDDDGDEDDDKQQGEVNIVEAKSPRMASKRSLMKSPFGRRQKDGKKDGVPPEEPKPPKEKKGWKLFQRKTDRKMTASTSSDAKEEDATSKQATSKEDAAKNTGTSKANSLPEEVESEDNGEEEEDDEDEDEEEDDDDEYEDDEEVSAEDEEQGEEVSEEEDDEEEGEDDEDDEEEDEDEEQDDEEYEDDSQYLDELGGTGGSNASDIFSPPDEGMERYEAVCDFAPEQTEDLAFRRGDILTVINTRDDGWWMAEDEEGNRGLVPSTYLKLKKDYGDYRDVQSPEEEDQARAQGGRRKSGLELWKGLRKAMNETSVTDVLTAMGAIPSGFRPSTTARLLKEDQYMLSNVLKPRLSQSYLAFKDLYWNPKDNQIRARTVRVQKMVSLMMLKNMPQVGAGLEIKTRHIRLAVFDGDKVLSNIHTVQATFVESDPRTWKFSPKMTSMLPSTLDGDCFVRTNHTDQNIGILFEICISYLRTKTGEKGELSCGWVHLPLFDEATGGPAVNKVYEVPIKGGTPYEPDVDVDPSISRKASTSKFRSMMTASKNPRLVVKLSMPTKEQKADLDTLPDTVVSCSCYISSLSMYRRLLAEAALIDRIDLQNTDLIHSPVLSSFPEALQYPDIMDALRNCWAYKRRTMKKSDKRDLGQMKKFFVDACMESIYLLLQSATLPAYKFGDKENEQERWEEISDMMQKNRTRGVLDYLLKPGVMHAPFDIGEVTFNLLQVYHEGS
ncbi:nephrocystin-1-like isoform X2 [Acanthaster planci]|nr:nephrocystin-1-like isoform X2 [Acanthaster planci]